MRKNETFGSPLRYPSNLCAVSLCGNSSLSMMWAMVSSCSLAGQALDERPGYRLLAGQGRVNAVRSLEFPIRGHAKNRLDVHDGIFLLPDELCYGYDVRVEPVGLSHLEGRVCGGPFLIEGRRGNPDPPSIRQPGCDAPHGTEVLDGLLQADLRLIRLGADTSDVVAAEKADHPVEFPRGGGRNEAPQRHRCGLGGYPLVDGTDTILGASHPEQMAQYLQPGLQIIGDAVADAQQDIPGFEGQQIDAPGKILLCEEFQRGPSRVLIEAVPRVLVSRLVQAEERR